MAIISADTPALVIETAPDRTRARANGRDSAGFLAQRLEPVVVGIEGAALAQRHIAASRMKAGVGMSLSPNQNLSTSSRPKPALATARTLESSIARTAARATGGVSMGSAVAVVWHSRRPGGKAAELRPAARVVCYSNPEIRRTRAMILGQTSISICRAP